MKTLILSICIFILSPFYSKAQEKTFQKNKWIKGEIGLRTFWMSTQYQSNFKEDYALGQSYFLSTQTKSIHGFSVSGKFSLYGNLWSSNLLERDSITGNVNRYEMGLFDVMHPKDRFFGRLEELQVNFKSKNFYGNLGRMNINTPFVNLQDGRLSSTFVEGLHLKYQKNNLNNLGFYFLNKISPRSTSEWFKIGDTFGIYPVGQNDQGNPSQYFGNTYSKFISILNWQKTIDKGTEIQMNHTLVHNVSSSFFLQAMNEWKLSGNPTRLISGVQLIVQHGIGEGGNAEVGKRYKSPEDVNFVFSSRLGFKNMKNIFHLNYTRISGNGRYLSPREWGRDPFFTFIPRERNEGFSDVNAITLYYQKNLINNSLQLYSHGGLHFLPHPSLVKLNKYGLPSYAQVNLGVRYQPKDNLKNLNIHFIYMVKKDLINGELRPAWEYNKVNLTHINLIANYQLPWN
jgi:N6-adenosine-specific RNA methylase IME4